MASDDPTLLLALRHAPKKLVEYLFGGQEVPADVSRMPPVRRVRRAAYARGATGARARGLASRVVASGESRRGKDSDRCPCC